MTMRYQSINASALAQDWLRALRGRRSQVAFSRRLGYRSNIAYRWESGRSFPPASKMLAAIAQLGGNVGESLEQFYRFRPGWLERVELTSVAAVGCLLNDLRGKTTVTEIARRTGYNRFAVARWLRGQADPSLPQFLTLVGATSERLLDFVASFTALDHLPSVRDKWRLLVEAREAAYSQPWSFALLRCLELVAYQQLPQHEEGWLAEQLGIAPAEELRSIAVLERSHQIEWTGSHYRSLTPAAVDTRAEPLRALQLRAMWGQEALLRLLDGAPGIVSYNLSSVSYADRARIEQLQRAHYRQVSSIVAQSSPAQCVLLQTAQLVGLSPARARS